MRVLKIDEKDSFLHLVPEVEDDLWHLERIVEKHDLVSGITDRRIKPREEGGKPERIKLYLTIEVEKVEFHKFSGKLRVSGKIVEGKPAELLEIGAEHALEVELGREIKVKKQALKKFQVERIRKAAEATKTGKTILVVLDDENASLALLKEFALEEIASIRSGKSGKQFKAEDFEPKYFSELLEKITALKPERAVVAGPGFSKDNFQKFLAERKPKGIEFFFASTNSVGKTGLQELVKGNVLEKVVQEMQLVKETGLVEKVLAELGKNSGLVEYGLKEVGGAVELGAVETLLVADKFLLENREIVEKLMQDAERSRAKVHLVNAEHEAGKQLTNLGGIVALLRYRLK
jgi:protein pelota